MHVDDLVSLVADVAAGGWLPWANPDLGPVAGGCTAVNVAAGPATARDYMGTVSDALGSNRPGTTKLRGPAGCSPTGRGVGLDADWSTWACGRSPSSKAGLKG